METFRIGTSAYATANTALMKEAGIGWVRQGFRFPFVDHIGGALTEDYVKSKADARSWLDRGFQIMGGTPGPGIGTWERDAQGMLRGVWHRRLPPWMGEAGSAEYRQAYAEVCEFLAQDLKGMVQMWQICNEQDIAQFRGPVDVRQACDLVLAGARGLKRGDPSLLVGTNTASSPRAYYLYGYLYADADCPLDYCGVDAYYGTWHEGGPELWDATIAELYAITGLKILVNEWGYNSAGGLLSDVERREQVATGLPHCHYKKWRFGWREGHTPEMQAEYYRTAFQIFAAHQDKMIGAFSYRWEDQDNCWQCGQPDCPMETAWGIVSQQNAPKPGYYAFQEGAQRLLSR